MRPIASPRSHLLQISLVINTHFGSRRARWAWVPIWPRRTLEEKKEKRDKQCIPENTAYTSTACCVSSLPGLSPTALSAPLPPRGEPWDSEPA